MKIGGYRKLTAILALVSVALLVVTEVAVMRTARVSIRLSAARKDLARVQIAFQEQAEILKSCKYQRDAARFGILNLEADLATCQTTRDRIDGELRAEWGKSSELYLKLAECQEKKNEQLQGKRRGCLPLP